MVRFVFSESSGVERGLGRGGQEGIWREAWTGSGQRCEKRAENTGMYVSPAPLCNAPPPTICLSFSNLTPPMGEGI